VLIPLRDHNPRRRFPVITVALIAVNLVAFLWTLLLPEATRHTLALIAGAVPREIITLRDLPPSNLLPLPASVLTSMFLHGGFAHLLGNMWFLWLFGDNLEDRMGSVRFLIFYLFTGVIAVLAQAFAMPRSLVPMIGASGAVAGVLGGYVLTFPQARVTALLPIPFVWPVFGLPAWAFLGLWFVGQFFLGSGSGIAWMAHVGGFLAGVAVVRLLSPVPRPEDVTDDDFAPPAR
jgi:membrane associated rhomboid family serine protease